MNAVAVVAVGDTSETRRLVAYVVPGESEPTPEELSALAHEKLPNYMVPAQYLFLGALPLSPTGKVDRKALATRGLGPGDAQAVRGTGHAASAEARRHLGQRAAQRRAHRHP